MNKNIFKDALETMPDCGGDEIYREWIMQNRLALTIALSSCAASQETGNIFS